SISNIHTSETSPTSAGVFWVTNRNSDSQVEYGTTASYGSLSAINPFLSTGHTVYLSSLSASTLYHYRVISRDPAGSINISDDNTFMTRSTDLVTTGTWIRTYLQGATPPYLVGWQTPLFDPMSQTTLIWAAMGGIWSDQMYFYNATSNSFSSI